MQKVTIVSGNSVGRGLEAIKLAKGKRVLWADDVDIDPREYDGEPCIIIYNSLLIRDLVKLKKFIRQERVAVRVPYGREGISMERPEIVVITNDWDESDFNDIEGLEVVKI